MFNPLRESALTVCRTAADAEHAGCTVTEIHDRACFDIRGRGDDAIFRSLLRQVSGIQPPTVPNTVEQGSGAALFWMSPDQWLLLVHSEARDEMESQWRAQRSGCHAALTDVSGGFVLLSVQGKLADAVVRAATPYDVAKLSERNCAQSVFAKAPVLMWKPQSIEYNIMVRRSMANYVYRWLVTAVAQLPETGND